MQSVEINNRKS